LRVALLPPRTPWPLYPRDQGLLAIRGYPERRCQGQNSLSIVLDTC